MKILFEGNISKIATVEALLLITGMMKKDDRGKVITKGRALPVSVGTNILPWHEQRAFRSPVFTRMYKLTLDNKLRFFSNWIDIKIFYDLRMDYANVQVPAKEADKLKFLVEQGFKLLQQEKPEEAHRIGELLPDGILNSLGQKVVGNGDGSKQIEEEMNEKG